MVKNKLFSVLSPIINSKDDKEELFNHINECIEKHTGNPLRKSKLAKLTADIFGYDNPHILPSKLKNISLTKAIEDSQDQIINWVDELGGYWIEERFIIPLFEFNDHKNNTLRTFCFMMKFNIINHENYILSLTTMIAGDTKQTEYIHHISHNEISESASNSPLLNEYGYYENAEYLDDYVEEDKILIEVMHLMQIESCRNIRSTKALEKFAFLEPYKVLRWDINELKLIYKTAASNIANDIKNILGKRKNVSLFNSDSFYEKPSLQYLICNSENVNWDNPSEYKIEINFIEYENEVYTIKCNNYREALNYAHYKILTSLKDNSCVYEQDFEDYDNVKIESYKDYQNYAEMVAKRKVKDFKKIDFYITVTDLQDKENPIYIELFDKSDLQFPVLTYL